MLLDVLHLLTYFFEFGLQRHNRLGQFGVIGFGPHSVDFAIELLDQKVHAPANRVLVVEHAAELDEMALEARDLLADVAPVRIDGYFLGDPLRVPFDVLLQAFQALNQAALPFDRHLRSPGLDLCEERFRRIEPCDDIPACFCSFGRTHRQQAVQGTGRGGMEALFHRLHIDLRLLELDDIPLADDVGYGNPVRQLQFAGQFDKQPVIGRRQGIVQFPFTL